jgi:hypothetical protein
MGSKTAAAIAAALIALGMGACGVQTGTPDNPQAAKTPTPSPKELGGVRKFDPHRTTPPWLHVRQRRHFWGESVAYEDGMEITLTEARMKSAGEESWGSVAEYNDRVAAHLKNGDVPVKFTLQVRNNSSAPLEPSQAYVQVIEGEAQLDEDCIDADCSIDLSVLRPGRSVKGFWMCWVPAADADNVTVEASAGYTKGNLEEYEPMLYVGSVR